MAIVIDTARCPQNHRCPAIRKCPVEALSQQGHDAPTVDEEKCTECGACVEFCPTGALQRAEE